MAHQFASKALRREGGTQVALQTFWVMVSASFSKIKRGQCDGGMKKKRRKEASEEVLIIFYDTFKLW